MCIYNYKKDIGSCNVKRNLVSQCRLGSVVVRKVPGSIPGSLTTFIGRFSLIILAVDARINTNLQVKHKDQEKL